MPSQKEGTAKTFTTTMSPMQQNRKGDNIIDNDIVIIDDQ